MTSIGSKGLIAILLLVALVSACDRDSEIEIPGITFCRVGDQELKLDLVRPPQNVPGPYPAIVMIHGGGWTAGSRTDFIWHAQQYAKDGYVAVTVDYRLAPKYRFPAAVDDVKCAVRWLRDHAAEYNVDRNRIGTMGASAGGHLALMAGLDRESGVHAIVNWCGPTDLVHIDPVSEQDATMRYMTDLFIGGTPETNRAAFEAASPVSYVTPQSPPVFTAHGETDVIVPFVQALTLDSVLRGVGVPHEFLHFAGVGHDFLNNKELNHVTDQSSRDFFRRKLKER